MPEQVSNLEAVVRGIRRRAAFARISALAMVGILTLIGIATAFAFVQATSGPTVYIGPQSNLANASIQTGGIDWIPELTKAFIRIAGVIMAVFLINILVSFAKYNLRVANYLESRADVLEITDGNVERLVALLPAISVDPLDFIRTPMSPFDTYLETVRGVLPGRGDTPKSQRQTPKPDD